MTTFVKVCPKCGQHNPEYENACSICTNFIGMETPIPESQLQREAVTPEPKIIPTHTESPTAVASPAAQTVDTGVASPAKILYIQVLNTDQIFEIQHGLTMGQAHHSSDAGLQLRDVAGIEYVHRNHCTFTYDDGAWQVTPIDQRQYGRDFTNLTKVNQTTLQPGQPHALKNGDQLSLAYAKFVVRII